MKKIISLILTICVVFSLYAYCFNNGEPLSFTASVEKITSILGDISNSIQGLFDTLSPGVTEEEAEWWSGIVKWLKDNAIVGPAMPILP